MQNNDDKIYLNKDDEIIKTAKERLNYEIEKDDENRKNALSDLEFLTKDYAQWDDKTRRTRNAWNRTMLQINILPKYVDQVTGEMRMNKMKINVIPDDDVADEKQAENRSGMIKEIEYNSSAENIYDAIGDGITSCGYGAARVCTEYNPSNPFEQIIKIKLIDDPVSTVYLDSSKDQRYYNDANYGFVLQEYTEDEFKKEFPGKEFPEAGSGFDKIDQHWMDSEKKTIVAEYFYKEFKKETIVLLSDDRVMEKQKAIDEIERIRVSMQEISNSGGNIDDTVIPEIIKERDDYEKCNVKWCRITANEIIERGEWAGTIIPIVIAHGKIRIIAGERYVSGLVRNAKDAQRMYNYWYTTMSESIALAPESPIVLTPDMIKGFKNDYLNLSEGNLGYLLYNPDSSQPSGPRRLEPSTPSPALFNELNRAENNIENTIGMHKADVGQAGRELSGTAIEARQLPGHVSTFIYQDNLSKAIEQLGKIIVDAMPKVYDNERTVKVRRDDGTDESVPINTTVGNAMSLYQKNPSKFAGIKPEELQKEVIEKGINATYNSISEGKYRVVVTTGPAFETKRQEAAQRMLDFAQISSTMNPVDKYYYLKNADWEGSDDMAEAVRKQIPYGVLPPKADEKPPPPPQPNPIEQIELQIKMLDRDVQKAKQINEAERLKTERAKQLKEALKIQNDARESGVKIQSELAKTIKELSQDITVDDGKTND